MTERKREQELKKVLASCPFRQVKPFDIRMDRPERTLFIIGNGFDIMHGVTSRYYDFRDSISKRSSLRETLEIWIRKENLWSDFETSLAYIDANGMLSTVDSWMDDFDVKDENDPDFSAADFFLAQEAAMGPAMTITQELPKQFRRWANTLTPKGSAKPLAGLLHAESQYINFNYTEFLETLYDIPTGRILYIHGDRRNKQQELILGHAPEAEDEYNLQNEQAEPHFRGQGHFDAYQGALLHLNHYYDSTTKKCDDIIRHNKAYFSGLQEITDIIAIGHSMSIVDYPYFFEIIAHNAMPEQLRWWISWHGVEDLRRIESFVSVLGIRQSQVALFNIK